MYVLISCYLALFSLTYPTYQRILVVINSHKVSNYEDLVTFSAYSLNFLLTVTISFFFKFHARLILTNSTTIENMDKKTIQKDSFNRGLINNWYQVFGRNKWLWLLPMTGMSGKPIGDGVIWTQENYHFEEDVPDNENDVRKSLTLSGTGNIAQILAKESSRVQGSPKIGPNFNNSDQFRGADIKKKEDYDTKPSSIDSKIGRNK